MSPINTAWEKLENEIGSYPVNTIIKSLTEYMYAKQDPKVAAPQNRHRIAAGCLWILLIAIAQQEQKHDKLSLPGEKEFYDLSQLVFELIDMLMNPEYREPILRDFQEFPQIIKDWRMIDARQWKTVIEYLPTTTHNRNKNIETQSNYVRNPVIPIGRSYKLTHLFIESLEEGLKEKLRQYLKEKFFGMSLESLHIKWSMSAKEWGDILTSGAYL